MTLTSFFLYLSLCLYVYKTTHSHSPLSLALINNPLNGFQWRVCVWNCVHLTCCLLGLEHGNQWSISSPVERPKETVDADSFSFSIWGQHCFFPVWIDYSAMWLNVMPSLYMIFEATVAIWASIFADAVHWMRWIWITKTNITIWGEVWGQ